MLGNNSQKMYLIAEKKCSFVTFREVSQIFRLLKTSYLKMKDLSIDPL